jgi:single-strand DNA-binding protein
VPLTGTVGGAASRAYARVKFNGGFEMINKVILVGHLTADPEVRATPKGVYVANMRLATNTYAGKDEAGNSKEQTEFHRLVVFGKQAETAGEYLRKGRLLYVEGRIQTNSWDDAATGTKKYRTEVVVDSYQMLGPKPQEAAA